MPLSCNQYVVGTGPGSTPVPAPAAPNRKMLVIQNTGANPGQFRLGQACRGDGGDMLFAAGEKYKWDQAETCPTESLNFASAIITTWAVIEGIG